MKRLNLLSKSIWLICIVLLTIMTAWQMSHKEDSPVRSKGSSNSAEIMYQESQEPKIIFRDAYFNILSDYRNYYAEYEPLCFTAITPGSPDDYGLQLAFNSNMLDLSHIEYAEEGRDFQILKNNTLFIPLDREIDVAQDKIYKVRPVFSSLQKEFVSTIRVNCMTMKAFEKAGGKRTRDIINMLSIQHCLQVVVSRHDRNLSKP